MSNIRIETHMTVNGVPFDWGMVLVEGKFDNAHKHKLIEMYGRSASRAIKKQLKVVGLLK